MKVFVYRCFEDESVDRAAQIMRDQGVGMLPVVDDHSKLRGVITDRDLAIRVVADRLNPATPVSEVMTSHPLVTCAPEDDLSVAEARMARWQKSRILVVDRTGYCAGVISLSDVALAEGSSRGGDVLIAVASRESRVDAH